MATWIVGGAVALVVAGCIRSMYKDMKSGKSSCGGDCSKCRGGCH